MRVYLGTTDSLLNCQCNGLTMQHQFLPKFVICGQTCGFSDDVAFYLQMWAKLVLSSTLQVTLQNKRKTDREVYQQLLATGFGQLVLMHMHILFCGLFVCDTVYCIS